MFIFCKSVSASVKPLKICNHPEGVGDSAGPVHQVSLDCSDCIEAIRYEADSTARCFVSTGFYELPYQVNQTWSDWFASATFRLMQGVFRLVCCNGTCAS